MATITEDYVSFEVAKLLKEKGFDTSKIDGYFQFVYYSDGKIDFYDDDKPLFVCKAVTLQMAMKWLREIHNIFISITYENDGVFTANLKAPLKGVDCMVDNKHNCWFTYEEAAEASIKYCLENLI